MAISNLPKTGVQAVVEGLPAFKAAMDTIQKEYDKVTKASTSADKGVSPLNDTLEKTKGLALAAGSGVALLVAAVVGLAVAGAAAAVALGKAFLELAQRGAPLQEIGTAFDHITANIGLSSKALLFELRQASEGTVADFDLIRTASTALLGVTGEFGTKFGKALPEFLKIAKVEADATGRSVNELFNNLVEGVKRGTPKLIESTGLVIDQKAAFRDYAESLGITEAQLSDVDRSQALLNATLAAGAIAIDSMSGSVESNADKLDRINASTTNIFDSIAVSLQPIFGQILDSVQTIINGLATFAPYVAAIFQFVGGIIAKIVGGIAGAFSDPDLAKNLFKGAAATFGSFANGIIKTANELIFPAIIGIAKFIADLLIGFSPPPKGPLSVIDKGGENLMLAWLDGISGVSLDPVTKVAKEVSDALGAIGKQSLVTVNTRLAQLDKSLLPFQNRLDIIKSQFEELSAPAKAALDAIDRQSAALQEAVLAGDPIAAEKLRQLDLERDAIQKQLDLQQRLVDSAQIQLGLKQAQQAPERALLSIRKAALELWLKEHPTIAASVSGAEKIPKEKKLPAGTAPINTPVTGASTAVGASSVLDMIGGQDAIDAAKKNITDAFMGEIDTGALDKLGLNKGKLDEQIGRINSVDIGKKISDKFKPISDAFDPSVAGSIANNIFQFFNGDVSNPNSIAGIVSRIGDSLNLTDAQAKITAEFNWFIDPTIDGSPANIISRLTGDASIEGSVAYFFAMLPQHISDAASGLLAKIKTDIFDPVGNFLTGTEPGTLGDIINQAIGFFVSLPLRIVDALRGLGASVYSALAIPVIQAINGLIGLVESGVKLLINKIADFASSINDALGASSPQFLKDTINQLRAASNSVAFGRISEQLPAFLQSTPLAGAKGGIFGKGFMTVGEHGKELMYNASKMGVVPHEITSILTSLSSIMAQPQPMAIGAGNSYNNSNSSYTFNGVQSDNDARRRYNYLRAGMR